MASELQIPQQAGGEEVRSATVGAAVDNKVAVLRKCGPQATDGEEVSTMLGSEAVDSASFGV